ncbi:MAG: LuxR C-terminal-related transcriptional regulator, partial [Candidatus Omnitrophica bacterium]|nr:LuxR C-terminal-related transcriptional regulator [Candidatus Omnitrophota bacterium]
VKGTRSTISRLPALILKAKELNLKAVENISEADIENIQAKESNPLNNEAKEILIFILQGKALEEIAKAMNFPDTAHIYRRTFYSVYGKIPSEVRSVKDNWRHSQLISAAKYALAQGWIVAEDASGADKIIANPLTNRERSILETAVNKQIDTNRHIADVLNVKPHTVQVFVDEIADKLSINKDGRNTLIECVKAGHEKGYINCGKESYDNFIYLFYNSVKLSKLEAGVLVYSAMGFETDKIALRLGISRRRMTTDIYGEIRRKLGVKLEPGQKMVQIMDGVIKTALQKKAVIESDILSAIWEEERGLRLAIIEHILAKGYFVILNGVLNKLSKKLAAEQPGVKEETLAVSEVIIPEVNFIEKENDSLADAGDLKSVQYEELPNIANSEFSKAEDSDMEMETLQSYFAFKYPTREEQKALAEAIKNGKMPGADARAKARAKQAQDKLITGSMQRIIKKARDYKYRFPTSISLFDLSHEIVEYVIGRLDKFDPDKGDFMAFIIGKTIPNTNMNTLDVRFSRIIIAKGHLNGAKLPAGIYSSVKKVNGTIDSLRKESGGNDPTISQIADRLRAEKSTVEGVIRLGNLINPVSLDAQISTDNDGKLGDILGAEEDTLDRINLKGIAINVSVLMRKAIERYNRYELKNHRRASRITLLKKFVFIQFLIKDKSFEEVRDMAEKKFGYRFNTKQNMGATAWEVVGKLETKVKYNSLKPFFDFRKVERMMGVPGIFGKISAKYAKESQGKGQSSSPIGAKAARRDYPLDIPVASENVLQFPAPDRINLAFRANRDFELEALPSRKRIVPIERELSELFRLIKNSNANAPPEGLNINVVSNP